MTKLYLGDSVYLDDDGYYLRLYLNNGDGEKNEIFLDPNVIEALFDYIAINRDNKEESNDTR